MVLPGEEFPPEPKRARSAAIPMSAIGRRLAELEGREQEAGNRVDAQRNQPQAPDIQPINPADHLDQEEDQLYRAFIPAGGLDDPPRNEVQLSPVINRADYYRDVTYQERILQEEANWRKIIPAMFIAFMPCSRATFQWVDPNKWDHDMNEPCNCALWKRSTVTIDTIDWCVSHRRSLCFKVKSLLTRERAAHKQYLDSRLKLDILKREPTYNEDYFIQQWSRQRECQLNALVHENTETLSKKLAKLVGLEQSLQTSELSNLSLLDYEFELLRAKRRRDRTRAEQLEFAALPESIAVLKAKIEEVVDQLGGDKYRDTPGASNDNVENITNAWMMQIVGSVKPRMSDRLVESKEVLNSLLSRFTHSHSRLCITWNIDMLKILNKTVEDSDLSQDSEVSLELEWRNLAVRSRLAFQRVVEAPIVKAEPLDQDEAAEFEMEDNEDELLLLNDEGNGDEVDEEEVD
ncbi:uncharacterized protein MELLADRAFT_102161 [Melampsora larici-populina 98AG31]|uniref:Uncharacterized protein n=1 Tax=Melampsora larici-populina (strain 98AG31 / pathotype 3-4-7) TaxID=747676 RepID=F4R7E2_MELLP|nr:uncharacterized protein MELLADRAFT_102161 [Melampsora larici-populina 98AG31]EGG11301.1 hypothetical protein MELLADRAFT_102161 [Melampsora larici-populina 98AG31]